MFQNLKCLLIIPIFFAFFSQANACNDINFSENENQNTLFEKKNFDNHFSIAVEDIQTEEEKSEIDNGNFIFNSVFLSKNIDFCKLETIIILKFFKKTSPLHILYCQLKFHL